MTTLMNRVVSPIPYCLEDSVHRTRPGFETFLSTDDSQKAAPIDKRQAKRLYRLQRTPYVNSSLCLDKLHIGDENENDFERTLRKQLEESSPQPIKGSYIRPLDVSNAALSKYTLGNTRQDPHQLIPSQITAVRPHPAAITILRHEQGRHGEIVPRFSDRSVSDRIVRSRLGPGGAFIHGEDCREAKEYLRKHPLPLHTASLQFSPGEPLQLRYTSMQQSAYCDLPWDSKLPPKLPAPLTTYEANGGDPLRKSRSSLSTYDFRTYEILEWDRTQTRNTRYNRKPFNNVAPLPRGQQIPGYTGAIGGDNLEDIENPDIDFTPYTIVRTEQPKFTINPFKINVPSYTGKVHYNKLNPVSHYDQFGGGYTTTAAFHKPLPFADPTPRHGDRHGALSTIVTTVIPKNPFNKLDITSDTINTSIDSRSQIVVRASPTKRTLPLQENIPQEIEIVTIEVNN